MEGVNPFIKNNKHRMIMFLDELGVSLIFIFLLLYLREVNNSQEMAGCVFCDVVLIHSGSERNRSC